MENKDSTAAENIKKNILDTPEEMLKRYSKSFRAWCVFRDFFTYWAGGLILTGWIINIINGLRFSFSSNRWWIELLIMCGCGIVSGVVYIIANGIKKHAARLAVEANKNEEV